MARSWRNWQVYTSQSIHKIIHIINHPPAYEEHGDKPRPAVNWTISPDLWIGIWESNWADQMAAEVLKVTRLFKHEIWQPDLRANKVYSHSFKEGYTHILFPAVRKKDQTIISDAMLNYLKKEESSKPHLFHLSYPHYIGLNKSVIDSYRHHKFLVTFHGEIDLPINRLLTIQRNPLKKIIHLRNHFYAKRYFSLINHVTYQSNKNLRMLKLYYTGPMTQLTMGVDTSKFRSLGKKVCREHLKIRTEDIVLLTVCMLCDRKQIDKFIDVLINIPKRYVYIVAGHGVKAYEDYLYRKSKPLQRKKRIIFIGFKPSDELLKYYNAADLFVHVSKSEAGPVSVMEAMACGVPVLCTDTGHTAELLKQNNCGIVVDRKDTKEWGKRICGFLEGESVKALDIKLVKHHYEWKNVARRLFDIYSEIST